MYYHLFYYSDLVFDFDWKKFSIQFSPPYHLSQASKSNGNMASTKTTMNIDAFLESEFLKWDAPDRSTFKHLEPSNVIVISWAEICCSLFDASSGNTLKKSLKKLIFLKSSILSEVQPSGSLADTSSHFRNSSPPVTFPPIRNWFVYCFFYKKVQDTYAYRKKNRIFNFCALSHSLSLSLSVSLSLSLYYWRLPVFIVSVPSPW